MWSSRTSPLAARKTKETQQNADVRWLSIRQRAPLDSFFGGSPIHSGKDRCSLAQILDPENQRFRIPGVAGNPKEPRFGGPPFRVHELICGRVSFRTLKRSPGLWTGEGSTSNSELAVWIGLDLRDVFPHIPSTRERLKSSNRKSG